MGSAMHQEVREDAPPARPVPAGLVTYDAAVDRLSVTGLDTPFLCPHGLVISWHLSSAGTHAQPGSPQQ